MIAADARLNQVCLNLSQAAPNPDGSFTYVIGPTDPGVANWLDTVGLASGLGILRWQATPPDAKPETLLREFRVINQSELAGMTQLPRVTPTQRRAVIARRAADYASRTT
jgi:hypothetical protein